MTCSSVLAYRSIGLPILGLLSCALFATSFPQGVIAKVAACVTEQNTLKSTNVKYQGIFKELGDETDKLVSDSGSVAFDVIWKRQDSFFYLQSITIHDRPIMFGIPKVAMKMQNVTFSTSGVRTKLQKVGQYPEFSCSGGIAPTCDVKWRDITTNVPEAFMQEQDVRTQIPELTFTDTHIVVSVPETFVKRQKWIVATPEFRLTSTTVNEQDVKNRADALRQRAMKLTESNVKDNALGIQNIYSCYRISVTAQRADVDNKFKNSVEAVEMVIQKLAAQGGDPAKVSTESGVVDLTARRSDIAEKREKALASFDEVLTELNSGEKEALDHLDGAEDATPAR